MFQLSQTKKTFSYWCCVFVLFFTHQRSMAQVSVGAAGGATRNTTKQSSPVSSNLGTGYGLTYKFDVMYRPLASVPISLGLFYTMDRTTTKTSELKRSITNDVGGFQIATFLPFQSFIPFIKAGYSLIGTSKISTEFSESSKESLGISKIEFSTKPTLFHVAFGTVYKVSQMFGLLFDYTYSGYTNVFSNFKSTQNGAETSSDFGSDVVKTSTIQHTVALGLQLDFSFK